MGGQALSPSGLQLDLTNLDGVQWLAKTQSALAGAGATWRDVQTVAAQQGRAVAVMQDSNIFTLGGSLSVNAHGKDPRFGPLAETVEAVRLLLADGSVLTCSPTTNSEVFAAVLGGYGQLGVVTQVQLATTVDVAYRLALQELSIGEALEVFDQASLDPAVELT